MKKELRVLVIEDIPTDLELIQHELQRSGLRFRSRHVETADEFRHELEQHQPDVILSDHGGPRFDGFTALSEARRRCPGTPFIFVTGQAGEAFATAALQRGADDCVFKNQLERLAPAIQRGLRVAHERTRHHHLQVVLSQTEQLLRALGEAAREFGVFGLNSEARVAYWHPSIERLLGWSAPEAHKREFVSLFPRGEHRSARQLLKQAQRDSRAEHSGWRLTRKDGSEFPATVLLISALPAAGSPIGWTCVVQDLTRSKQLAAELEARAERAARQRSAQHEADYHELQEFTHTLSQSLRTPLRHIDRFAELLQKTIGSQLDPKSRAGLRTIADSAREMGHQLDELLTFVRIGQAELYQLRFSLQDVVQEVLQDLRRETEERHIEWKVGPLPEVDGDPTLLALALHNLIANAVKFTRSRPDPQIQITGTCTETEVVIAVADNGVGFDPRHRAKLFGIFQRLHSGTDYEGMGIGLANVRRIVQRHGGRTWAEGAVDTGATFYFALPRPPARLKREITEPSD